LRCPGLPIPFPIDRPSSSDNKINPALARGEEKKA